MLREPNITATTTEGKLAQLTDYIIQTVREINLIEGGKDNGEQIHKD